MEMNVIYQFVGVVAIIAIAVFVVVRAIEHWFWRAEHKREVQDEQNSMIAYKLIEYRHKKQLCREVKGMAMDITKQINDNLLENAKQLYKELEP